MPSTFEVNLHYLAPSTGSLKETKCLNVSRSRSRQRVTCSVEPPTMNPHGMATCCLLRNPDMHTQYKGIEDLPRDAWQCSNAIPHTPVVVQIVSLDSPS